MSLLCCSCSLRLLLFSPLLSFVLSLSCKCVCVCCSHACALLLASRFSLARSHSCLRSFIRLRSGSCFYSLSGQSTGLLILRSSDWHGLILAKPPKKTENSNLRGFMLHSLSSKCTKLLFQVIKAIINHETVVTLALVLSVHFRSDVRALSCCRC